MTLGRNSWVFIIIGTATPSVKSGQAVQKIICKSRFQISRIVRKFLKCHFFKLTKLLANKTKQVNDLKTYLEQLCEK